MLYADLHSKERIDINIAFIPVRGGSKSIPMKNIRPIAGRPLVYWTAKAAAECPEIDRVYIATDDKAIADTVQGFHMPKVEVVSRSPESAADAAPTESALLEFAEGYAFDTIALIQATSPLLRGEDLSRGFAAFQTADSVLSVVRQKRFVWDAGEYAHPVNYEPSNRPRRQDFDGYLVENGAFYITSREALLRSGCRLSGNVKAVEMPPETYIELDEPSDWLIVEALMRKRQTASLPAIKIFLTDCDGTLTDGGMYYSPEGEALKKFHTRDALGLRLLRERGIITGVFTGETSPIVYERGIKMGVDEILPGVKDKKREGEILCQKYGCSFQELAYIGDDINDLGLLNAAGVSFCPSDAHPAVKSCATHVLSYSGGHGAVRQAADYILESECLDHA